MCPIDSQLVELDLSSLEHVAGGAADEGPSIADCAIVSVLKYDWAAQGMMDPYQDYGDVAPGNDGLDLGAFNYAQPAQ